MQKMLIVLCFTYSLSGLMFSQPGTTRWPLPFPDKKIVNIDSVRNAIDLALTSFDTLIQNGTIKEKIVDDKEEGFIARVYTWQNKLVAVQRMYNWACNGTRTCYFDSLGRIRAVLDFGHGMSWFNSYYAYTEPGKTWVFNYSEWEIGIGDDHLGHYPTEKVSLSKKLWLTHRDDMEFDPMAEKSTALRYLKKPYSKG